MGKKGIFLSLILVLLLSGCSKIDTLLEEQIIQQSGIQDNPNYQQYQTYSDQGLLNEDGYYLGESLSDGAEAPSGTAHLTFSENSYLEVHYYMDAAHTEEISTSNCYLSVGSTLYATTSLKRTISSSAYAFAGFRIYEYEKQEGKEGEERELVNTVPSNVAGPFLTVEEKDIGKELAIEPIGNYIPNSISLRAYCTDDSDLETSVSGTWIINDMPAKPNSAGAVEINPVSSYIISFDFDENKYFYFDSEPECLSSAYRRMALMSTGL